MTKITKRKTKASSRDGTYVIVTLIGIYRAAAPRLASGAKKLTHPPLLFILLLLTFFFLSQTTAHARGEKLEDDERLAVVDVGKKE